MPVRQTAGADMAKSIYRDEYRVLLETLRGARDHSGMTQAEVAKALGWAQSSLSHTENGSRRIDVVEFIDYCHVVGIQPQSLFSTVLAGISALARDAKRVERPMRPRRRRRE